jgi:prophage tail gpP-like protein
MSNTTVIAQVAAAGTNQFTALQYSHLRVRKSLDEICHSLELQLPASERNKVHKHDKIEVRYTNPYITDSEKRRRVTTAPVDEVSDTAEASKRTITVTGRSPARDIIDSAWSGTIGGAATLEQIATNIGKKFGIAVSEFPVGEHNTKQVKTFSWENESPWIKLISEAQNQGFLFTSNEAGGLYLWRVAKNRRTEGVASGGFTLTEGMNIKRVEYSENGAEQFHRYVVRGGGAMAEQIDDTCKNKRELVIVLTDSGIKSETLRRRALTEMRRRKQVKLRVAVDLWGLTDEQLKKLGSTFQKEIFWNPNFIIPVSIPSLGIRDNLLTSEVEYAADTTTMEATLTLTNREVYL